MFWSRVFSVQSPASLPWWVNLGLVHLLLGYCALFCCDSSWERILRGAFLVLWLLLFFAPVWVPGAAAHGLGWSRWLKTVAVNHLLVGPVFLLAVGMGTGFGFLRGD